MSQFLTLELSDRVYETLTRQAEVAGISLTEWVAISLNRQCGLSTQKEQTDAEKEVAIERFRRHAGAIDREHVTFEANQEFNDA